MRNTRTSFTRYAAALGLALMLTLASQISSARTQQDNHNVTPPPVTYNQNGNSNDNGYIGIPYNTACRNRCNRNYRRCLRRAGKSACRKKLRSCLQRCPQ